MLCCSQRIYEICTRNSIPVFEAAGREGFQAVECDIHETAKDKKGKRRFVKELKLPETLRSQKIKN